jgi:ribokinase
MSPSQDRHIVVVGSINSDFSARGPHLPKPGETTRGKLFHEGPGGKGANQAAAAARLGARVTMIARIGTDDRGRAGRDNLRKLGVNTDHIAEVAGTQTGAALLLVEETGQKEIMVVPGANDRMTAGDVQSVGDVFAGATVVMAQLEVQLAAVLAAFQLAKKAGARTILDPSPAMPLPDELYHLSDIIKPNVREAMTLTGVEVRDRNTARQAADILLGRGVSIVAIQAGDEGDLIVGPGEEHFLPRFDVGAVDATGAGDAFAAGLAVALAEGMPLGEAGSFASATAALATTKFGAQAGLPTRDEVDNLLTKQHAAV